MDIESLASDYRHGASLKELAERHGWSPQTIGRRLQAHGVALRGKRKTDRQKEHLSQLKTIHLPVDRLQSLRQQGLSTQEIGESLGVSEETARRRMVQAGVDRLEPKARPERNAFWRGGLSVDKHGYILEFRPDHPQATASGCVRQHRLVVESQMGRYLSADEVVDHRNGDTSDNRPENLRVFSSNADHLRATLTGAKNLPPEEREARRRAAVRRARARVAAILAESGTGDGRSR